ncbi:ADP-ribose pyrophosphatase [Salinarchaeum sp. Harcht-Bsk1]|uniref:NUDIX domain-containing protein n=1 Tax=Salinarchaeum sp. Harcht-Bsk1 TaxID=1333523 RepID=UPI0003424718|nr:NUDIX hydrolase [Salinarchaeum sp. Harcht-Bsk1]AGN00642.1 ADP-ribose pyrophosphatase [Salinarchaeum sp. Harcht-Bsk1]
MDEFAYVVNVDVAVHRDDEYLFIERGADEEHAAGLLGFPGGKLESDPGTADAIEATAIREVEEEVGVVVESPSYVHSSTFTADEGTTCLNVLTRVAYVEGRARPCAGEEVDAVHWLTPSELAGLDGVPSFTRTYLERVEADRDAATEA